jgi:bacterioferritin-associated ferredoxin
MYVCVCNAISYKEVKDYFDEKDSRTIEDAIKTFGFGNSCSACKKGLEKTLQNIKDGKINEVPESPWDWYDIADNHGV